MRVGATLVLVLLTALAVTAPTASAADADVLSAWSSQNAELKTAGAAVTKAMKGAAKSRYKRVRPLLDALGRLEKITSGLRRKVAGTTASTPTGTEARTAVLESLQGFVSSLRNLRKAVQAASRKRHKRAQALLARSELQGREADSAAKDAFALFLQAYAEAAPPPPPPEEQQPPPEQQQQPPPEQGSSGGSGSGGSGSGSGSGSGGSGGGSGGGEEPPPPPPEDDCTLPAPICP